MMRKDVNKPKGKTSAYAFFVQTCREEHRKKNPEQSVNFAEFSKKCSERWKGLTPGDKKVFEDMAKTDKVRYNREMKDYIPPKGFGKRGLSAQVLLIYSYRPTVKQQYPGLSIGDCAKKLGEMWSKLTQNDKHPYEEKAQKLREKYDRGGYDRVRGDNGRYDRVRGGIRPGTRGITGGIRPGTRGITGRYDRVRGGDTTGYEGGYDRVRGGDTTGYEGDNRGNNNRVKGGIRPCF
uniref:High mobility group box 2b n=1 Tax=Neogobius melanostomus TaxID=47308 RepID=A0A8C6V8S3_9GOBI